MKRVPKGIEMKLIQILALAIAMATMATAQNSSANSQGGKATPTPSPTPTAAATKNGKAQPATKAATKTAGTGTPAKAANGQASAKAGTASVTTSSIPAKGQAPAQTTPKGKVTPTPVVAAKPESKTESSKTGFKTGAKKADVAKADTSRTGVQKAPAVIAVKPAQTPAKKSSKPASQTATKGLAVRPLAPKVTQAGATAEPAKAKESPKVYGTRNRRDPFVSPIVARGPQTQMPSCTNGKRCLLIPEMVLQGTIKDTSGKMLAVVANGTKTRTYFLRENDQVFQGSVEKITSDSIIFREYVKDALGRETAREVVKKLVPAS
jgi:Tfp pilus assembly protein PilP